ncbi:MAG: 50S ribosomal protein L22 [Planctomycetes bacterium]|nr:50S ribosomal protein L22 [Planctomycetota bacterium]
MAWLSRYRFARISARKVRLVADMIRDADVNEALNILKFTPNRAASMLDKVLRSAIANADNAEADVSRLYVQKTYVDEGPTIPRFRPKDRGRAHPIRKRTSHITVVVEED